MTRRGLVVALLGPDGSGKTTVAQALVRRFDGTEFPRAHYFRRWLGILPRHGAVKRRLGAPANGGGGTATSGASDGTLKHAVPGETPALGPLRALLQPAYQALELRLGAGRIRRLTNAGDLVVFDRYAYDAFIQTANRAAAPRALDLVCAIAPRPDLLLFLDGDAADIHARKPELPEREIARQQEAARRCVERRAYARTIDTRGGVDATVAAAAAAVLNAAGRMRQVPR